MQCLIVDDDKISRAEIQHFVKKSVLLKLVASCASALEAFNIIESNHIDLLFLDVMMPGMNGLELMKSLKNRKPQVILMTMEKNYAVEAFNYDVTDFLVKPVSEARFLQAVAKAKNLHDQNWKESNPQKQIFIKVNSKLMKIDTHDILYIEALENYVSIYTAASKHTIRSSLKTIMDKLSPKDFVRVHNSYLVRLDKITGIEGSTIIVGKHFVPYSRGYKDELMSRLNLL
ncbi:MAG TPA: LytTR family DNA-binding domain-containing protein [Bacteroidia bacterium]|nr:LytTR family DNA-binding domain-containing protein [Bacteroidia bacterium]